MTSGQNAPAPSASRAEPTAEPSVTRRPLAARPPQVADRRGTLRDRRCRRRRRRCRWRRSRARPGCRCSCLALGGLVSLGVGLSVERLIADLFQAAPWLGWVALVLLGSPAWRSWRSSRGSSPGIWRERQIERAAPEAVEAIATRDHTGAQAVVPRSGDPLRRPRGPGGGPRRGSTPLGDAILDVDDRIGLAEHELLGAPRPAGPQRHRGRGQAGLGGDGAQPARHRRRRLRGVRGRAAAAPDRDDLRRPPGLPRLPAARRARPSRISPSPAAWRWARA